MDFGNALASLREGQRVARSGWNGRGQWLFLIGGMSAEVNGKMALAVAAPHLIGDTVTYAPWIAITTFKGGEPTVTPWLASQADLLADDWYVVGPPS
jgi:Protein of unknown function (DUF2829)